MAATDQHEALIEERGAEYGESYITTDRWLKDNLDLLARAPNAFVLIMLHNKLTRALTSPYKRDHYDDIIGYAKLALRQLEATTSSREALHWLTAREEEDIREQAMKGDLDPEMAVRRTIERRLKGEQV